MIERIDLATARGEKQPKFGCLEFRMGENYVVEHLTGTRLREVLDVERDSQIAIGQ